MTSTMACEALNGYNHFTKHLDDEHRFKYTEYLHPVAKDLSGNILTYANSVGCDHDRRDETN